jgi:hypothetical protein
VGSKREWRKFEEAREFVRSLALSGEEEWKVYYKSKNRPKDIPSEPNSSFEKEYCAGILLKMQPFHDYCYKNNIVPLWVTELMFDIFF